MHFCSLTGTKAQGWARADVPAQRWTLKLVSRTGAEINALIRANPYIGSKFESYLSDGLCDAFTALPPFRAHTLFYSQSGILCPLRAFGMTSTTGRGSKPRLGARKSSIVRILKLLQSLSIDCALNPQAMISHSVRRRLSLNGAMVTCAPM
jgi:hypothetical protein